MEHDSPSLKDGPAWLILAEQAIAARKRQEAERAFKEGLGVYLYDRRKEALS